MKYFVLFLACLSLASALTSVTFAAVNTTVDNQSGEWNFRASSFNGFSILVFNGFQFASLAASGGQGNVQADGVFGAAYTALGLPPSVYVSFFDVAAQFSFGANGATANVNASRAVVGTAYLSVDELNPAGDVVRTIQLKNLIYVPDGNSLGNGGLRFAAVKGNLNPGDIIFTVVVSDTLGVLNVPGNPTITPKSMEVIVELNNYGYANPANNLRLNMGVGTGAATVNAFGSTTTLVSGAGNNGAYVQFNNQAQVNGQLTNVVISDFVEGSASAVFSNGDLEAQVNAKYAAGASFKTVSVSFPAGASQILYDPSLGVGNVPNSAFYFAPSVLLLLAALFLAF